MSVVSGAIFVNLVPGLERNGKCNKMVALRNMFLMFDVFLIGLVYTLAAKNCHKYWMRYFCSLVTSRFPTHDNEESKGVENLPFRVL